MRNTIVGLFLLFVAAAAAAGDSRSDDGLAKAGEAVFSQTCVACHGNNGKGAIPGVRDLTPPDGPLAKSDEELLSNITNGLQTPGSPMAMPPKGGNPALDEDDIKAVIAYLRARFGHAN